MLLHLVAEHPCVHDLLATHPDSVRSARLRLIVMVDRARVGGAL